MPLRPPTWPDSPQDKAQQTRIAQDAGQRGRQRPLRSPPALGQAPRAQPCRPLVGAETATGPAIGRPFAAPGRCGP